MTKTTKTSKLSLSPLATRAAQNVLKAAIYIGSANAGLAMTATTLFGQVQKDARKAKGLTRKEATKRLWRKGVAFVRKSLNGDGNVNSFKVSMSKLSRVFQSSSPKARLAISQWKRGKYGQPFTIDSTLKFLGSSKPKTRSGPKAARYVVKVDLLQKAIKRARRGQVTLRVVAGRIVL